MESDVPDEHPAASTIDAAEAATKHHLRTPVVTISPSVPVDRAAHPWLPLSMERVNALCRSMFKHSPPHRGSST